MALINDIVPEHANILKALRDAAMQETDAIKRANLKHTADALQVHIKSLNANATPAMMRKVQCIWTRALVLLTAFKFPPDGGPNMAGGVEGALLSEAA